MISERPLKVLLIDDDEEDFLMLRDHLSQSKLHKFDVQWASSYDDGLAALTKSQHDVCFLDYRLGAKSGLELLKQAITEGAKVPMILLTGYGEQHVDLEAMKIGAADYLIKEQVNPHLLERSIRYSIHRAKATQEILERETQMLMQERLASVGLLASSLAHEIGTPLGVIRGRAEYLEFQVKDDPNLQKHVEVIISQIDRVSKLIRSLLNLARGDEMKSSGQVFLSDVVSEVIELMGHELRRHDIQVKNELPTGIPVKVMAEAGPLHQVLLNLLVNSVHAIDTAVKGGRVAGHSIRISMNDLGKNWGICVEDTGCGISEKNMKNLFKPFFTTKDIGVGTGLGLATSYRIVESWGGSFHVRSVEGKGSEFEIVLPKHN